MIDYFALALTHGLLLLAFLRLLGRKDLDREVPEGAGRQGRSSDVHHRDQAEL